VSPEATSAPVNVAAYLPAVARRQPSGTAVVAPDGRGGWSRTSWAELDARSDAIAHGLSRAGLVRGDRTCLFVRPSADWVALVYALYKLAAVPVLIDPGMGRKSLVSCVQRMRPRGFIGIPLAHALRLASPRAFASVEVAVTVGRPKLWSGSTLETLTRGIDEPFEVARTDPDEKAAILFTSGSTGPPKGVAYTHGMFAAQVEALHALYGMQPGDVDLACFPLFALFGAALELESVLPDMDFSKPAQCDPARIAAALNEHDVVQTFGSPAIWRRVVPWCRERGLTFPKLERLMIAGAPVSPRLIEDCLSVLAKHGDVHTPYGATESLPVSSINGRTILEHFKDRTEKGAGNCVGKPAPGVDVRLIEITDAPLSSWSEVRLVAPGEAGEICVRGPVVTREYELDPEATAAAKIQDGDTVWHRIGDVGRFDDDGWLWFQGRKSHRLETEKGLVLPVGIENVFNLQEHVRRSALVGVGPRGRERPVLVVETEPGTPKSPRLRAKLKTDILRAGLWFPQCGIVEDVLYRDALPVDVRHNAKIKRGELKVWAEEQLR
jgi:acyl-CoA synthetase (AMP-forming)/AMP-acid ligase II